MCLNFFPASQRFFCLNDSWKPRAKSHFWTKLRSQFDYFLWNFRGFQVFLMRWSSKWYCSRNSFLTRVISVLCRRTLHKKLHEQAWTWDSETRKNLSSRNTIWIWYSQLTDFIHLDQTNFLIWVQRKNHRFDINEKW